MIKNICTMRRIQRARAALRAHLASDKMASDTLNEQITDLLTDLRHLCAAKKIDFEASDWMARQHFEAEAPAKK